MGDKWHHVISQIDNWIWALLAVASYWMATVYKIEGLATVAGVCIMKMKEGNGK